MKFARFCNVDEDKQVEYAYEYEYECVCKVRQFSIQWLHTNNGMWSQNWWVFLLHRCFHVAAVPKFSIRITFSDNLMAENLIYAHKQIPTSKREYQKTQTTKAIKSLNQNINISRFDAQAMYSGT